MLGDKFLFCSTAGTDWCVWVKTVWTNRDACPPLLPPHPSRAFQEGISAWGWWCSSQPFVLYLTGDTMTFLGDLKLSSICFSWKGSAFKRPPRSLCLRKASSQDPLGCWTFSLCKSLATSRANIARWLRVSCWDPRQKRVNGVKCYLLAPVHFTAPWRTRASCMKLGWRSQNCKTSSQIPAGMCNLATWHSPLFAPLSHFPC